MDDNDEVGSEILACSSESEDGYIARPIQTNYYGKNKYKRSKNPPAPSSTRLHNIIKQRPSFIGLV